MKLIRRHLLTTSIACIGLVAAAAWVAFGWFGVHTLFIDRMVDEELPVFAAAAADAPLPGDGSTPPLAAQAPEPAATDTSPPAIGDTDGTDPRETDPPTTDPRETDPPAESSASNPAEPAPTDASPPASSEPTILVEAAGSFSSLGRYTTVGTASVLGDGSGQRFLRFEDFETSNGPDLRVYLVNSSAPGVSDHVDLGELRGNIGSQNYEIPVGLDLTIYDTVMIWCERFSSGFGEALLEST